MIDFESYYGVSALGMPYLMHHGILGQKWGTRNGPPYPLKGGDYTQTERKAITKERRKKNSIYNKKHFDQMIDAKKATLTTLSYNKDRTKNTDMFFAAYKYFDKHQYNAMFNKKVPQTIYDEDGNAIGTGEFLKFKINNNVKSDMKVASEDSGAEVFRQLYKNDRDFYNFVTDKSRMQECYPKDKYVFKGYREAMKSLDAIRENKKPSSDDLQKAYRLFNYVIPNDGGGNARVAKDVLTQRTKFFKALKDKGYGAVLDVNDAIYGGFKASAPVIIFDMEQIVPKSCYRTDVKHQLASTAITAARKATNH